MRTFPLFQVDAFTRVRFQGNPAGVVLDADPLSTGEMQAIARELNNSETAFLLSPDGDDHDVRIRYFTPTVEVPTCGHATVAAHYVRAREGRLPSGTVRQKIGIGTLPVEIVAAGDDYRVFMTQGPPEVRPPVDPHTAAAAGQALGVDASDRIAALPIQVVSTGAAKVMVALRSLDTLNSLQPDLPAVADVCRALGCNGFMVFVPESEHADALTEGRMFAPAVGIPEDPVTGNGNGPLGAYLVAHGVVEHDGRQLRFRGRQGVAMGRPGIAEVIVDIEEGRPRRVRVGGNAVIAFRAELSL